MTRWHDDDALWEAIAPFLFTDERCGEAAREEVEQVGDLLGVSAGAKILDLCCGAGRHSLELARQGFSVTGVDRTAAYLDRARRDAAQQGLAIEFLQADARTFCRPGAYDGIVNLYTSFGYFDSDEEELAVLKNAFASLKPNGRLVMELKGKEILARNFQARSWSTNDAGTAFLLEERKVQSGWSRIDNRWIIVDDAGPREFRWTIRVYSGHELETLLCHAGFTEVSLYGSLAGAPYDHEATRLVAVARK
jgi:SAM-dependent methyltransferase